MSCELWQGTPLPCSVSENSCCTHSTTAIRSMLTPASSQAQACTLLPFYTPGGWKGGIQHWGGESSLPLYLRYQRVRVRSLVSADQSGSIIPLHFRFHQSHLCIASFHCNQKTFRPETLAWHSVQSRICSSLNIPFLTPQ